MINMTVCINNSNRQVSIMTNEFFQIGKSVCGIYQAGFIIADYQIERRIPLLVDLINVFGYFFDVIRYYCSRALKGIVYPFCLRAKPLFAIMLWLCLC